MTALSLPLAGPARALRLELKRSAVPFLLPLLAAVFYYNTVRTADGFPPIWTLRASVIGDHMLFEFGAFAGGLAAWAGSREGRRKTLDLVATTPRAAWARLSTALAGTLCWLLLAFLAGVALIYVRTALQATWGGPPLWPVFMGIAAVTVITVIGFTCGVVFPGRFTAPLVAVGTLVLYQAGFHAALGLAPGQPGQSTYALLSPADAPPGPDAGVYYSMVPDRLIVQVMLMGGIAIALFGALGLAPDLRRLASARSRASLRGAFTQGDSWLLRTVAMVLIACGTGAAATAVSLAGTARPDTIAGGWEIPALHSASSDRPLPAVPVCTSGSVGGSAFQVCVHPAFSYYLHDVAAALDPVQAEIAGLPGAPVGAREVASLSGGQIVNSGIAGSPPVFDFTAERVGSMFGQFNGIPDLADWRAGFQMGLLDAFLARNMPGTGGPTAPLAGMAAQQAVENALLIAAGTAPSELGDDLLNAQPSAAASAAISGAARRFLALSASARRAWLATHLAALRAGTITLAQIP
jgi:hypothetical protein